jgi:hypothetical protein
MRSTRLEIVRHIIERRWNEEIFFENWGSMKMAAACSVLNMPAVTIPPGSYILSLQVDAHQNSECGVARLTCPALYVQSVWMCKVIVSAPRIQ